MPAGIELMTSRLRQLRQLPVVQLVRFMPLKLCKKNTTTMTCQRLCWTTGNPSGMHIHTTHYSCILSNKNNFSLGDIQTKVGVAMLVYWMIWYCYCFRSGFKCTFSCIVQYSLYHNIYMNIGTMWHYTLVSSTPSQSIGLFFGCALF